MVYQKQINSVRPIHTYHNTSSNKMEVLLEVGNKYVVAIDNPTNKKDRLNNNRIVEILGFTDNFMGDVIVRYLDNNRRGRVGVCVLLPY